ncbi:stemmadenine O-acetyltransferase-like [Humulus lupulus]|uniref:stemmadenine O-acetyltransferase-like n=1 Tax=Humulus lupulus TaxID=3486 RepID=UPI002B404D03|nr:stemmadenine O-acetyltransferase-like [Humulus lupulus]
MDNTMKVEILSRELVKPSTPTPAHRRDYKLCLLDQFLPENHGGITFFYSSTSHFLQSDENDDKYYCRILKKSLSDTLTDFYPIAGRFKDTSTIDCNDNGACVVEATINSNLSDFLTSVNRRKDIHTLLGKLVPTLDSETMELASKCMLIAQITVFKCGGVSISFCLEHRFCDFSSVMVFLKSWSARARGGGGGGGSAEIALPDFVGSTFLPPQDMPPLPTYRNPIENRNTTRLVFDSSNISALKSRYFTESSDQYKKLSRVEVVLALILRSAISAARSSNPIPADTKSVLFQAVNLRNRTEPPLPENSIGNLFWLLPVTIKENDIEFHELINKMKGETTSFHDETVRRIKSDEEGTALVFESMKERGEVMKSVGDVDVYCCSSWCRFPVYEMDFGWGNPVWVSSGVVSSRNLIVIEDTKCGGGIQAWVTLDPKVIAIFERDQELLSFASLNPNILI